mmetsp:Transcript_8792/g.19710  ORF Transcript_8792/g.19710 Transcript_8792/m.19710 type:complete len:208 (+) Transcript_8792:453-1076(+)
MSAMPRRSCVPSRASPSCAPWISGAMLAARDPRSVTPSSRRCHSWSRWMASSWAAWTGAWPATSSRGPVEATTRQGRAQRRRRSRQRLSPRSCRGAYHSVPARRQRSSPQSRRLCRRPRVLWLLRHWRPYCLGKGCARHAPTVWTTCLQAPGRPPQRRMLAACHLSVLSASTLAILNAYFELSVLMPGHSGSVSYRSAQSGRTSAFR